MSSMKFFWEHTIVVPQLPYLFCMAKAVSSTVVLLNLVNSVSVKDFNFAMCPFTSKCLPIELVPCSDEWQQTWWHMIHILPVLRVSSIWKCTPNHHDGTCLESFQAVDWFEPTLIEANQVSNMICNNRFLKSQIKTSSFLDNIITSSNQESKDFETDMMIEIWKLRNSSSEIVKSYVIVE